MMKVLFISSGNKNGVNPIIRNQAEALMASGLQIDYYLIKGKGIKGYLRNIRPLRKYLKEHSYDAIHAHYSLSAFVASLSGANPLVVSLMGSDVKAAGWYKLVIRVFAGLFRWKTIIVKSNDMYQSLGIIRAIVIPNGVNLDRFRPMDKTECTKRLGWGISKKHILFPAAASRPEKDFALAQAAVAYIPNAELHAFENTPNVETPYWYNAADVVLMTSKWEGSPNAIKEALACSRPIVATNVGDISERLKGLDGCFVDDSRNPKNIADDLLKAMAYNKTRGNERILSDGLDSQTINTKLIKLYQIKMGRKNL